MKVQAFQLRVKRVSGLNNDMTPKIENILVKLVGATAVDKYCKHINIRGFIKADPPRIEKVLFRNDEGEWVEDKKEEIEKAQVIVDKYTVNKNILSKDVDYKTELEDQKKRNDDLESRLKALEGNGKSDEREALEVKANELEIKFRANIGDDKLLEKIKEVDPEYKLS